MIRNQFYNRELLNSLRNRQDITATQHCLNYETCSYNFLKIISNKISPEDKIILISAGIHGEEIAGPLTLLKYLNPVIDYAHANNLKIIVYPIVNPSGFEEGARFNAESDNSESLYGPNDFVRYILNDGTLIDDLKGVNCFKEWLWSSDEELNIELRNDTHLLHSLLKSDPLHQIFAAIDLHQDYITKNAPPAAYQYLYGNSLPYYAILQEINTVIPLLKNTYIDAGYLNGGLISDSFGTVVRYDGTLSDLMHRVGVNHVVTVETTGITPLEKACRVNLIWIKGLIDLIKKRDSPPNPKEQ